MRSKSRNYRSYHSYHSYNSRSFSPPGRVASANANRRLPLRSSPPRSVLSPSYSSTLTAVSDRRAYHPLSYAAPAAAFSRPNHRLVSPPRARAHTIAFSAPDRVLVCVRRHTRKEVLHALGKTGTIGQKRPRRNYYSSISC